MVTNTKELQAKEFLQRVNIKTMKKDLARLREADAMQEREKIGKIQPIKSGQVNTLPPKDQTSKIQQTRQPIQTSQIPINELSVDLVKESSTFKPQADDSTKQTPVTPSELQITAQNNTLTKHVSHFPEKEVTAKKNIGLKKIAKEAEKQKIFLLESQRLNLKKQLITAREKRDPFLTELEKNKMLLEQKSWQERLNLIVKKEQNNKTRQNVTDNTAKTYTILEDWRQEKDKERWYVERKLAEAENKIKQLDQNQAQLKKEEDELMKKVAEIDESLRMIYDQIATRETVSLPDALSNVTDSKKDGIIRDKKEDPLTAIERFKKAITVEKEQRRKFMEDVEKWAADNKNSDDKYNDLAKQLAIKNEYE